MIDLSRAGTIEHPDGEGSAGGGRCDDRVRFALRLAGELDVDLVEISATAVPPVCRLMDYGKFKYQEQKKAAEAKS